MKKKLSRNITFTELRNNARKYFDEVERGGVFEVYRHGKPIALISPTHANLQEYWQSVEPLEIPGLSLSAEVLRDRSE